MNPPPVTKSFGTGVTPPHRMSLWAWETMTASLCATLSNPSVITRNTSAFASDASTVTGVASTTPPCGGKSPVSAKDVSSNDVWIDTPVALPLYRVGASAVATANVATASPRQATTNSDAVIARVAGEFAGIMV